ncbi:MAG: flagellar basal body rod protein [Burkholderiales bacterium]
MTPTAIARFSGFSLPKRSRKHLQSFSAMNPLASTSLSGMSAAQTAMSASAFNIAGLNVDGFRRQQVQQSAVAPAGVTSSVGQAVSASEDMVADVVGLLQAKNAFLANLAVFKTSTRMTGALLDTLA